MWIDEATVAHTVKGYALAELLRSHSTASRCFRASTCWRFSGLTELLGYQTIVLRALPFIAYRARRALLWMQMLLDPLSPELPAVLFVGVVLALIPTTWPVYGVMLKQYSLEVMLALCALALSDRTLSSLFEGGRGRWRAALLGLPWLISYGYVFAITGRCAAWLLWRLRQGDLRLDARAAVIGVLGLAAWGGLLYYTDIQHTPSSLLTKFWQSCLLVADQSLRPEVIDHLGFAWYRTSRYFRYTAVPPALIWVLRALLGLGLFGALASLARGAAPGPTPRDGWGSRAIAVPLIVLALILGSVPLSYPLCAGRLTLFVLPPLQILILEGLAGLYGWLDRVPRGSLGVTLLCGGLGLALLPSATSSVSRLISESPPGNLRLALAEIDRAPDLPVVVDPCTHEMIRALPGGWSGLQVMGAVDLVLEGDSSPVIEGDVWVLSGVGVCWVFGDTDDLLRQVTRNWRPVPLPSADVRLRLGRLRRLAAPAPRPK